jgi:hypothetical protein
VGWFPALLSRLLRIPRLSGAKIRHSFPFRLRHHGTVIPFIERLEDRTVPADWLEVGPKLQFIPQGGGGATVSDNQNVAGLVSAIAFSPDYDGRGTPAAYMGSAGGGRDDWLDARRGRAPRRRHLQEDAHALGRADMEGGVVGEGQ